PLGSTSDLDACAGATPTLDATAGAPPTLDASAGHLRPRCPPEPRLLRNALPSSPPRAAMRLELAAPRSSLVVALLLALGVYAGRRRGEPVLDDGWVIFGNSTIKRPAEMGRLWRLPYAARPNEVGFYRPVTMVSYALTYAAFREDVRAYH